MYRIFQLASLSFYYVLERGFICAPLAWPDTHPDSPPRGVDTAGVPEGVPWPPAHGFPQPCTPPTLLLPTVGHVWVVRSLFGERWCPTKADRVWAVVATVQAVPDGWRWHQSMAGAPGLGLGMGVVMPAGFPGKSLKTHISRKSVFFQIWGQNNHPPSQIPEGVFKKRDPKWKEPGPKASFHGKKWAKMASDTITGTLSPADWEHRSCTTALLGAGVAWSIRHMRAAGRRGEQINIFNKKINK